MDGILVIKIIKNQNSRGVRRKVNTLIINIDVLNMKRNNKYCNNKKKRRENNKNNQIKLNMMNG